MSISRSTTRVPSYETFSDDALLALAASPESLTEVACRELGTELQRRGISEERVEACRAEAVRIRTRQERWTKVRRLRFKRLLSSLFVDPFALLTACAIVGAGAFNILQAVFGLDRDKAALYAGIAAFSVMSSWTLSALYLLASGRADELIRRRRRRLRNKPLRSNRRARAHASLCAARNWTTAAFLLGFSLLMFFYAHRDLAKPMPASRESLIILLALVYCIGLFVDFFVSLSCVRERVVLGSWAVAFLVMLAGGAAPAFFAPYAHAVREFSMILWLAATLMSWSLFRSAIHAPPPGAPSTEE